jgi:putative oxidoreductase
MSPSARIGKEADMEKASYPSVPLRLAMGIIFSVAGYSKLVGIAGTIDYFTKLGFPLPVLTAWFIGLLELGGGIALILGLFVRYLGLLYTIEFIVATFWINFRCRATLPRGSM